METTSEQSKANNQAIALKRSMLYGSIMARKKFPPINSLETNYLRKFQTNPVPWTLEVSCVYCCYHRSKKLLVPVVTK